MRMILKTGVGKSCILDSFYFALFGTTMREISKLSYIVNRKVGKNCIVRLEADITDSSSGRNTYLIERKIAPQSLKIWKNGNEITKSTVAETNKFIEELFLAEKDIFQNCIIMRANNTIPFMAKKKADKKNFIETIFNLDIFSKMGRYLRDDIRNTKSQYSIEKNTQSLHENNILSYQKELERLYELQNQYETHKQQEIETIKIKIDKENKRITDYNLRIFELKTHHNQDSDVKTLQNTLNSNESFKKKLEQVKSQLSIEEGILRKELSKLEKDTGICPTCKRAYDDDHITNINNEKAILNEKIIEIVQKLKMINEKLSEVVKNIDITKEKVVLFESLQGLLNDLQNKIQESSRIINVYNEQIASKDNKVDFSGINNFKKLINDTETSLNNVKITVENIEKDLGKMNICEHILGEYGVRAYIVNKLLDVFNNRIQYYLNAIKSTFNFRFNEYFEEEIKDSNGIVCLYSNCSGAEMKKIDLAISFAINDMITLQKQVTYNVIFFDEILDSSLDDKSLNIILNFISEHTQKENKAVYIISHKSGIQIPFVNEVITLEKINGFTKRIIE